MSHSSRDEMLLRLSTAATICQIQPPRRPWLEPLPESVTASALEHMVGDIPPEARIGIIDDPSLQCQPLLGYHPHRDGTLLFVGDAGSGKTTALRMIAYRLGQQGVAFVCLSGTRTYDATALPQQPNETTVLLLDDWELFREHHEFQLGNTLYQDVLAWITRGRERGCVTVLSSHRVLSVPPQLLPHIRQQFFFTERHPEQPRPPTASYLTSLVQQEQHRIPGRAWFQNGGFREVQFGHPDQLCELSES